MTNPKPGERKHDDVQGDELLKLLIKIEAQLRQESLESKRRWETKAELASEITNFRQKYENYGYHTLK